MQSLSLNSSNEPQTLLFYMTLFPHRGLSILYMNTQMHISKDRYKTIIDRNENKCLNIAPDIFMKYWDNFYRSRVIRITLKKNLEKIEIFEQLGDFV